MEDANTLFTEYMDAFKELDISEKRIEIINSIKEVSALLVKLADDDGISLKCLNSKEILNFKNGRETEEEFLEALLVYIENFKEILGQYLLNKI